MLMALELTKTTACGWSQWNQRGWMRRTAVATVCSLSLSELNTLFGSFSSFGNQGLILHCTSSCFLSSLLHWVRFLTHLLQGVWCCRDPGVFWALWPLLQFFLVRRRAGRRRGGGSFCLCCSGIWGIRFSSLMTTLIFLNCYFALLKGTLSNFHKNTH